MSFKEFLQEAAKESYTKMTAEVWAKQVEDTFGKAKITYAFDKDGKAYSGTAYYHTENVGKWYDTKGGFVKSKLGEAQDKKEEYIPKVGDDVRIPGDKVGQTIVGKVTRVGRSKLFHVKTKDGEEQALPQSEIFKMDLSCKNYEDHK